MCDYEHREGAMGLEYDPKTGRLTLDGVELNIAPWQATNLQPFVDQHDADVRALTEGAELSWIVVDELGHRANRKLDPRWFSFDAEYDGESWIDPALWDAAVDDGARVLRCGHCGASTDFNIRDHLDVLCEGCGTTYMARPTDQE